MATKQPQESRAPLGTRDLRQTAVSSESDEQHRLLFELNPNPMFVWDEATFQFLAVNEAALRLYGWSRDEFLQLTIKDIRPPESVPAFLSTLPATRDSRAASVGTWRHRKKDGTFFDAEITVSAIAFGGRPARLVLVRDVTDRLRAEEALRASEERYRVMVEQQAELVCSFDADGVLTFVNHAYCRYFARSREELEGHAFLPRIPSEDRRAVLERLAALSPRHPVVTHEHRVVAPDGQVRWQEWSNQAFFDSQGRLTMVQAVGRDVTARKQAEEALRASEERLRLTLEAADMGAWEWDVDSDVSVWNPREYEVLGLRAGVDEPSAANFFARVHPEDRPALERTIAEAVEGKGAVNEEFRIIRGDGQVRWIQSTGRFLSPALGVGRHMLGLNFDITERKELEAALKEHTGLLEQRVAERTAELQETNEKLRQEMARRRRLEAEALGASEREQRRIGHDLHDGLCQLTTGTVLLSKRLARVLRDKELPKEARLARQIARLIESVAEEARRLSHGLSPVALESDGLAAALRELARTTTRLSHIPCNVHCAPDAVTPDHTVDVHLFRIAQEAVNNAVRHAGAEHIEITVRAEGGSLTLAVVDDGCGIPRQPSTRRGLGLRLMRYRAEMIGGTFRVERGRPRGTTVRCVVPASSLLPG